MTQGAREGRLCWCAQVAIGLLVFAAGVPLCWVSFSRSTVAVRLKAPPTWSQSCKPYPRKRVVLVQVNAQYTEMFRNWLYHVAKFLDPKTEQLVVAAESQAAVPALVELSGLFGVHWDVQFIGSASEDTSKSSFWSPVWTAVVLHRPLQINHLLSQGCSVLYQDIDTVWTQPVFPVIEAAGKHDLYLASDGLNHYLCTCLMYYHPTAANMELNARWAKRTKRDRANQVSFNWVLEHDNRGQERTPKSHYSAKDRKNNTTAEDQVDYGIMPVRFFPWGKVAEKYRHTAAVLHANWVKGLEAKVEFLKHFGYWNPAGG